MALLPIVRLGHPALRTPASRIPPVELRSAAAQRLIDDMIETMRAAEGVGLAAPQVGVGWQLFVYEAAEEIPLRVLVNPAVEPEAGDPVVDWEGCLSIPDLRGLVPRHPAVRVRGLDRRGSPVDYRAEGFEARIVQHENDHLHGVVYLDRMTDFRSLAFLAEWHEHLVGGDETTDGERPE
jgi:peptide deformylase